MRQDASNRAIFGCGASPTIARSTPARSPAGISRGPQRAFCARWGGSLVSPPLDRLVSLPPDRLVSLPPDRDEVGNERPILAECAPGHLACEVERLLRIGRAAQGVPAAAQ